MPGPRRYKDRHSRPRRPNWAVDEEFMASDGSRFRILDMNTHMSDDELEELHSRGINGIWVVEPVEQRPHRRPPTGANRRSNQAVTGSL